MGMIAPMNLGQRKLLARKFTTNPTEKASVGLKKPQKVTKLLP